MVCYTKKHHVPFFIDDEDYPIVLQHTWHCSHYGYIATRHNGSILFLHRLIMNTPNEIKTDHINGNKLDNQKSNLRVCTTAQNSRNRKKKPGCSSKYKGVYWDKFKWHSQITYNFKTMHLGLFNNEEEAAMAYNIKATEFFGEYANLNKIEKTKDV